MKKTIKMLSTLVCFTLIAQLAGCGTLIHPERRGQRSGRIDPGIAILDGIGLLFFIIPGLIAFAIDFSTGAIYMPGSVVGSLDRKNLKVVKFDPKHTTVAGIEEIIWKETGRRVNLNQANVEVSRLGSLEDMRKRFAEISPREKNIRIVLNTK